MRDFVIGIGVAAVVATTGVALAGQPAYVGTWGTDAAQCKNSQEVSDAPMLIRKGGYDSHEAHCTFTSIQKSGTTWNMKTKCSVEGDQQTGTLTLSVKGQTLTVDGRWKLERC